MIDLENLNESDKGRWVEYTRPYCRQKGCIKSWNDKWVFVVYHCDNNWERYAEYTAAATDPIELTFKEINYEQD